MASGGPGDHWRTDLVSWGRAPFGEPVDGLLQDIGRLGGSRHLEGTELGLRLDGTWSRRQRRGRSGPADPELLQLADDLARLRDRLRAEAVARGWEVE